MPRKPHSRNVHTEHSKPHGHRVRSIPLWLRPLTAALALSASGLAAIPANAADETYDGTGPLTSAGDLGLPAWLSASPSAQGLLHGALNGETLTVDYASGDTPEFVIGGYSASGDPLSDNTVTLQNGTINGPVFGGLSHRTEEKDDLSTPGASAPDIIIPGTQADASASLTSAKATATQQAVNVATGNTVTGPLYGGAAVIHAQAGRTTTGTANGRDNYARSTATSSADTSNSAAEASRNQINIAQGAATGGDLYGGWANITARAAQATAGNANSNYGTYADADASAKAGSSTAKATRNQIDIGQGAAISGDLYGGRADITAHAAQATAGKATSVNITESRSNATAHISATNSIAEASHNQVDIAQGAAIGGDLYGGWAGLSAHGGTATGGEQLVNSTLSYGTATATVNVSNSRVLANENQVRFNGALQGGALYGGYSQFDIQAGTASKANGEPGDDSVTITGSIAQAINNSITIGESAQFDAGSSLYGGYLDYNAGFAPEHYDVFTNNTLNYAARTPTRLGTLANFEFLNFTLEPSLANSSTSLITAQHVVLGGVPGENISDSDAAKPTQAAVTAIHSGNVLSVGDQFLLVKAEGDMVGDGVGGIQSNVGQAQQGISLLYDVKTTVDTSQKLITAEILGAPAQDLDEYDEVDPDRGPSVNPQLKSLSEGRLAGLMLATRGADVVADDLYHTIQTEKRSGLEPFILISGRHNRYNSGSHIDSDDVLLVGGLSYRRSGLTASVFAESGWGNFDTSNSFANAASVRGNGQARYTGGGLFGRYDFASGPYAEASVRLGTSSTRFDSSDLVNAASGETAHYDVRSRYTSAHAGVGYQRALNERNTLDVSLKYLWTHIDGKSATVAGDPLHFDSLESQRVRLNGEFRHRHSDSLTVLAGLGYEYEFKAQADGTTYGYAINAPSLKGSTGILSLGATITPTENQRLSVDLRAQGYVGKRQGVGGLARVNYRF